MGENVNPHPYSICYAGKVIPVHWGRVRRVPTSEGLNCHPYIKLSKLSNYHILKPLASTSKRFLESFLFDSLWIHNWASNCNDQVFLVILGLLQWFSTPISIKTFQSCFVCDGFDLHSWNWTIGEGEGRDKRRVCSRDYGFSLTLPDENWMMKFGGNEDYIVRLKGWNKQNSLKFWQFCMIEREVSEGQRNC